MKSADLQNVRLALALVAFVVVVFFVTVWKFRPV